MQNAAVVLDVLRERGRKGLPCTQLYRQMFNEDLYLLAYGGIYANHGAMTPGASTETADGMSEPKISQITEAMRHERYRFSPARRTYIPKKNGKLRPLGVTSWSDKLVGEVVRLLLEAYYEPQFSGRSHGFRKGRGCHTALREIRDQWSGTVWFIEGDISDCYGSIDHSVLLSILAEKIHDNRFLRLISNMLKAGYLEDWVYHDTLSGCPQGGVITPPTQRAISALRSRWVTGVWSVAGERRGAGGAAGVRSGRVLAAEERAAVLAGVLDGVELGAWDRRVAGWLTGLDTSTLVTVASWIARSRARGRAGERDRGAGCWLPPAIGHYL